MLLQDKIAYITGGNSGIGLATARLFIAEGAKVAITGRNRQTLDEAAQQLGPNLFPIQADLQDIPAIEQSIAQAVDHFGKLDIVFANAGIGGTTPIGQTSLEAFENIIRTNQTAVFFTIQAALPHLNDKASIILNGSVHAVMGAPGWSAYASSKGAIRSMTRVLASELAPRGIRVNQVTPGAAHTPVWAPLASNDQEMAALEKQLITTIPLGRMAEADEIANVVLFLASEMSSNVTASEIVADGGATGAPIGAPAHRQYRA